MKRPLILASVLALMLSACANLQPRDPLQVSIAGFEALPGEGLELRMLVKLRVQNPNDAAVDYSGIYLQLDVADKAFATGVSDQSGSVASFGEAVISVPVTVSALRMARQMMGVLDGQPVDKIRFEMNGKLSGGSAFSEHRFQSDGELTLPR